MSLVVHEITPVQVRRARKLLRLTISRLAELTGMTQHILGQFERTGYLPAADDGTNHLSLIRVALEAEGIVFTGEEGIDGVYRSRPLATVTPAQVRQARLLLGMIQTDLARLAGVSNGYLSRFEVTGYVTNRPWGSMDRPAAIRTALERAGVIFVDGDEPDVKLR